MKLFNNFIAWLYIIITIALGMLMIISVSGWYGINEDVNRMAFDIFNNSLGIWTGLAMMIIGLILLDLRIKDSQRTRTISFDNPEGEVTITTKAIEDFVKRVGGEFSQVIDLSPSIIPSRGGIRVRVKTVLSAGANVPRLAESIQSNIKARIQNILGIESITGVEVHITKIVGKKNEQEQKQMELEEAIH